MQATIEVQDQEEADLITNGLENKSARAFVKIIGALNQLGDDDGAQEAKERALNAARVLLGDAVIKRH